MFFNLFKKKEPTSSFTDKTFGSLDAKKRACVALASKDASVIFVAWFPDTASVFKELFVANRLHEDRIVEVRNLHGAKINHLRPVFLEHFPLSAKEDELVKNWEAKQIDVYNSLDDALLKHFGGERIQALIKQMGMQEDEVIEHALISKSIRNAQDKIAEKVSMEKSAHSQKEWFEKNMD